MPSTSTAATVDPITAPENTIRVVRSRRGSDPSDVSIRRRTKIETTSIAAMITRITHTIPSARG